MNSVEISHIFKTFGSVKAVNDVSFSVEKGTIFGLLGPNGAGKTTTIRIMLDIFRPDSGAVSILDGPMTDLKKNRIGYMPEDRGIYQDIRLDRCLVYLGTLKGLSATEARQRSEGYLERFDLAAHKHKRVKELSKGMQQKAQIIVTLLHRPELIIVDEPFSGLDPVNTQMVIDLLREECDRGATILLCSHQMHQVEALCDRLVLIDHGQVMLYGRLDEIRRQYAGNAVEVRTLNSSPDFQNLPGVSYVEQHNGTARLTLDAHVSPQDVLKALVAQDVFVEQFEVAMPTLDEIFIKVVQGAQK